MVLRLFGWKTFRRIVWIACLAAALAACGDGGGGGGGNNPPAANTSNWDALTWDRDNWQ